MASIKVKFRPSAVADREGAVYYQIIHERKVRILPTPTESSIQNGTTNIQLYHGLTKMREEPTICWPYVPRFGLTSSVWPQYAGNSTSIVCVSLPTILWLNSTA